MNDKHKPHYTPTKLCPHRQCPKLHLFQSVAFLLLVCTSFTIGVPGLIFCGLLMLLGLALTKVLHGGKNFKEIIVEDERTRGELIVRPGWALTAAICDFVVLGLAFFDAFMNLAHPAPMPIPALTAANLIILGLVCGAALFVPYAHIQATKPARRSRVQVPAAAES